jgi:hypothetical protein
VSGALLDELPYTQIAVLWLVVARSSLGPAAAPLELLPNKL